MRVWTSALGVPAGKAVDPKIVAAAQASPPGKAEPPVPAPPLRAAQPVAATQPQIADQLVNKGVSAGKAPQVREALSARMNFTVGELLQELLRQMPSPKDGPSIDCAQTFPRDGKHSSQYKDG